MHDLNDLVLFAAVVRHGSFTAASAALGTPKSRVSRRVAELEKRLGVRLLQRSTRSVRVTEVGAAFFAQCEAMTLAASQAFEVAEHAGAKPAGRLRVSCPIGVAHIFLAPVLPSFLQDNPDVRLELELTNRRVDVIGEGYDVALRMRTTMEDSSLVVRHFGVSDQILAASPQFINKFGPFNTSASLNGVIGIGPGVGHGERSRWSVFNPQGGREDIDYVPALATNDVFILYQAAIAGAGVAQLPLNLCAPALEQGRLIALLPDYRLSGHQLHAVFPSRRGLVPAVRTFIETLARDLPVIMSRSRSTYEEIAQVIKR